MPTIVNHAVDEACLERMEMAVVRIEEATRRCLPEGDREAVQRDAVADLSNRLSEGLSEPMADAAAFAFRQQAAEHDRQQLRRMAWMGAAVLAVALLITGGTGYLLGASGADARKLLQTCQTGEMKKDPASGRRFCTLSMWLDQPSR